MSQTSGLEAAKVVREDTKDAKAAVKSLKREGWLYKINKKKKKKEKKYFRIVGSTLSWTHLPTVRMSSCIVRLDCHPFSNNTYYIIT